MVEIDVEMKKAMTFFEAVMAMNHGDMELPGIRQIQINYIKEIFMMIYGENIQALSPEQQAILVQRFEKYGMVEPKERILLSAIYKSLSDTDYLKKNGADKVVDDVRKFLYPIFNQDLPEAVLADVKEESINLEEEDRIFNRFPNDVRYLSKKETEERYEKSEKQKDYLKGNVKDLAILWDENRKQAHLGEEPAAKRASAQDWLWIWYLEMQSKKVKVDLGMLELRVRLQHWINFLWPNQTQVDRYNESRIKEKLPRWVRENQNEPPSWYLEILKKIETDGKTKFDRIKERIKFYLNELNNRLLSYHNPDLLITVSAIENRPDAERNKKK